MIDFDNLCYEVRARGGNSSEAYRAATAAGYAGSRGMFNTGPWRRGKQRYEREHGIVRSRGRRSDAQQQPAGGSELISYESAHGWFQMQPVDSDRFELTLVVNNIDRSVALSMQGQAFRLLFPGADE